MEKVKLGDIAVLINGDRGKNYPSQADITEEGDVPFVNAGHLTGRTIDFGDMNYISKEKYEKLSSGKFEKGDILYCLRGSLGKKAIVNDDVAGAIASSLVIIRPDYEKIDGDYLMFSLDSPSIKEQLVKANNGSSQPNLSAASVREYQIELPDISLQKEVVEKLTRVRNVIDERQKELNLLDELIKARFVEMFGDPVEHLDKGETVSLEKLADKITVGFVGEASNDYVDEGVPYLRTQNVRVNHIDLSGLIYVNEAFHHKNQKSIIHPGDVVISRVGVNRGMAAVIPDTLIEANIANCLIVGQTKEINSYYLAFYMNMSYGKRPQFGASVGSAQGVVNTSILKKWEVYVPDIALQNEFNLFMEQIDKSKVAVQKALEETQTLFNSLMQEYFG